MLYQENAESMSVRSITNRVQANSCVPYSEGSRLCAPPHVNVPNSSKITPSLHKKYIYGNHNHIPAYSILKERCVRD